MLQPLVSVIIPCYNCENTIQETIQSVFLQTYSNIEIVCINDGSIDTTSHLLKELSLQNEKIIVIDQNNCGQSATRNKGVNWVKGDFLLFLDADDKVAPTYIEKCMLLMEQNSDCEIAYSDSQLFGARTGKWKLPDFEIKSFLRNNCIPITALIKKKTFLDVQGFDESLTFFEDWDLWIKIIKIGGKPYKISEDLFYYRKHKEECSLTDLALKNKEIISKNKFKIYQKHYDFYQENLGTFDELLNDYKYKQKYYNVWYRKLFYTLKSK